jgi:hypothetical protein
LGARGQATHVAGNGQGDAYGRSAGTVASSRSGHGSPVWPAVTES